MPSLILMFKEKKLMEFSLNPGATITIGRHSSNDIVIDNLVVSGLHAHVDYKNGDVTLTDLQSKNGSFRNGERISQAILQHDDIITIGKHTLQVNIHDVSRVRMPDTNLKPMTDNKATMSLETPEALSKKSVKAAAPTLPQKDYLIWLAGGEGKIELTGNPIQIGKNDDAQISIKGLRSSLMGTPAALISKLSGDYWLAYANGLVKPKHNGNTVKGKVKLTNNDIIDIGPVKLQIQLNSSNHG